MTVTDISTTCAVVLFRVIFRVNLTMKMTTAQVVETSDTVNDSPIRDYVHPDVHTQPTCTYDDTIFGTNAPLPSWRFKLIELGQVKS